MNRVDPSMNDRDEAAGGPPLCTNYELRLMSDRRFNEWLDQFADLWDIPDEERLENRDYIMLFADGIEHGWNVNGDRLMSWEIAVCQEGVRPLFNEIGHTIRSWAEECKIGLPIRIVYGRLEDADFYQWLEHVYHTEDLDLFPDAHPTPDCSALKWWLDQARLAGLLSGKVKGDA